MRKLPGGRRRGRGLAKKRGRVQDLSRGEGHYKGGNRDLKSGALKKADGQKKMGAFKKKKKRGGEG